MKMRVELGVRRNDGAALHDAQEEQPREVSLVLVVEFTDSKGRVADMVTGFFCDGEYLQEQRMPETHCREIRWFATGHCLYGRLGTTTTEYDAGLRPTLETSKMYRKLRHQMWLRRFLSYGFRFK